MRVLVTGAEGMLGVDLAQRLRDDGHEVVAADVGEFDITDRRVTVEAVEQSAAEAVVHCAAYTDVEGAEDEQQAAFAVNADGARHVAEGCRELGCRLYLIGTDFVFDGKKGGPYVESDEPDPLSAYGRSKLEGERLAREVLGPELTVVRTAWLYGAHGNNFLTAVLRAARDRDTVKVVDDQRGSPTWTVELAACLARMLAAGANGPVYHAACAGSCSRFELAREWFGLLGVERELRPVDSGGFPSKVRRPADSSLASERLDQQGIAPPGPWRDVLAGFAREHGKSISDKILDGR